MDVKSTLIHTTKVLHSNTVRAKIVSALHTNLAVMAGQVAAAHRSLYYGVHGQKVRTG